MNHRMVSLIPILALSLALPACTIRASLKQTTDTTSNITASTSGKSWFTGEGLVKDDSKVTAFAHLNFENLKQDMAIGHGEYLVSLATLLRIPAHHQPAFFSMTQERYAFLVPSQETAPGDMLASLHQGWAAHSLPDTSAVH